MRVRLLGTAAGGGFPQWNCHCPVCQAARRDPAQALPRTQASLALSGDGRAWFLLNATPDIGRQMEAFPALLETAGRRGSALEAVFLGNADLDHSLGLLQLREGGALRIYASAATRQGLNQGLHLEAVLERFCGTRWIEPPSVLEPLPLGDGRPSGLLCKAFPVPGKPPRYLGPEGPSGNLGYRFVDAASGGSLVYAPDVAAWTPELLDELRDCSLALVDGTFWQDDEMARQGVGNWTAGAMAHVTIGGAGGSLQALAGLKARKVFVHINNTNPVLLENSEERRRVEQAGFEVGQDGMECEL